MQVKAITVMQPWASAIIHAGKDVENRNWQTSHTGQLAIHAGKTFDSNALLYMRRLGLDVPDDDHLPSGVDSRCSERDRCTSGRPMQEAGFPGRHVLYPLGAATQPPLAAGRSTPDHTRTMVRGKQPVDCPRRCGSLGAVTAGGTPVKLHERTMKVNAARAELHNYVLDFCEQHDLTDAEMAGILIYLTGRFNSPSWTCSPNSNPRRDQMRRLPPVDQWLSYEPDGAG